jgi:predicted transglutaminase-like cysteine proteinase
MNNPSEKIQSINQSINQSIKQASKQASKQSIVKTNN